MAIIKRLSWLSFVSVGTKLLLVFLLWLGIGMFWAAFIIVFITAPIAVKIFRDCITGNYHEPLEEKYVRLREQEIVWTTPVQSVEAYTGARRVPSPKSRSTGTRGDSSASGPTASSSSRHPLRKLLASLRPHTPALITAGRPPMDGVSL